MDTRKVDTLSAVVAAIVVGLGVGYLLTFASDGETPNYPHKTAIEETVEPIYISEMEPIVIESGTVSASIEAIVIDETEHWPPTTEAPTNEVTEPHTIEDTIAETAPPEPEREVYLTDREKQLMAQLVHSEAGTESYEVKQHVVDVVFNRVDSPLFPNTIEEVIYQKHQFSVIANGSFDRAVDELTEDDWLCVDEECYGRQDYGILYFNSTSMGYCANGKNGYVLGHVWFAY